jgi:GAF domain-containing protein
MNKTEARRIPPDPWQSDEAQKRRRDRATVCPSFLSEASRRLSYALSDEDCFRRLLEVMVPFLADWGTISLLDLNGQIWRAAAIHTDSALGKLLDSHATKYPLHLDDPSGPGYVIRTGKSELISDYGEHLEEHLAKVRYPGLIEVLRTLGVRSKICVPIRIHDQVLGALWLATSESGRVFDERDLELTEEAARRAGIAAYHIIRYARASHEIERLHVERDLREDYLSQVRHDVLSVLTSAKLSAQMIMRFGPSCAGSEDFPQRIVEAVDRAAEILRATKIRES